MHVDDQTFIVKDSGSALVGCAHNSCLQSLPAYWACHGYDTPAVIPDRRATHRPLGLAHLHPLLVHQGESTPPRSKPPRYGASADPRSQSDRVTGVDYGRGSIVAGFGASQGPVSKLHYLVPATKPSLGLCYNLVSSAANRFPVPTLLGYNGATGDSATTNVPHLAKLRLVARYLDRLRPEDDDDLVLIVDGPGVVMQLPPEVLIERYFEARKRSEARMAERLGVTVEDARSRGMRQTLFWGPDMRCSPDDPAAARCWAVPKSDVLSDDPRARDGGVPFHDVRYLNSGTAMGPVAEMRALMAAALAEMEEDTKNNLEEADAKGDSAQDQDYVGDLFGRQEYYRSLETTGKEPPGGPDNRRIPSKRHKDQRTEHHMAIDYKSILFQPRAGYGAFLRHMRFDRPGFKAHTNSDVLAQGDDFAPRDIHMPTNVRYALARLYSSIPRAHPGSAAAGAWVAGVELGVNLVTGHIYAAWHCAGDDTEALLRGEVARTWWYRHARSLVRASVRALQGGELITPQLLDGRQWAPKMVYPDGGTLRDELGGAWVDEGDGEFVEWARLCGRYGEALFAGEEGPLLIMASGDV